MSESNKLNLKFYKGQDVYSDGDIENEILDIVKKNTDFTEIIHNNNRWPILYHLTPYRKNLLEWYNFRKDASLLEIGGGCGAFTPLFCEKVEKVTVVELSKRRAEIISERCKDKSNLEIIVGNLNDVRFETRFDYITLIGVLEYAEKFTDSATPYEDFLRNIKQYLKPDGVLIIAIENKFGMKYWAGAKEDHLGGNFDGIENYLKNPGVRTFGKFELENILKSAGFYNNEFYYPMPDYKIPTVVYSNSYFPVIGEITENSPNYDHERYLFFNEKTAYDNVILNDKFGFFSNSFLVFCGEQENTTIYSKFSRERLPQFQIQTSILNKGNEKVAIKNALNAEAVDHIKNIHANYLLLKSVYNDIQIVNSKLVNDTIEFEYIDGKPFNTLLLESVMQNNKTKFFDLIKEYIAIVKKTCPVSGREDFESGKEFLEVFGTDVKLKNTIFASAANIDLVFSNIIFDKENKPTLIDYEWVFNFPIPINYIIFRSVYQFLFNHSEYLNNFIERDEIYNFCGFNAGEILVYSQMENNFQEYVYGKDEKYRISQRYLKRQKLLVDLKFKIKDKLKSILRIKE